MRISVWLGLSLLMGSILLTSCAVETAVSQPPLPTLAPIGLATAPATTISSSVPATTPPTEIDSGQNPPPAAATATATVTASPQPTNTPLPTPTATPIGPCSSRIPDDDLLVIVTQTYGLSREFAPDDLVLLTDHLPFAVTQGYPTELRAIALAPLQQMVADMQAAGLQPWILSGYRSYAAQAISWEKWNREEPERAAILSARPGHSEHQLGTTIDFGSPELATITGILNVQFHTYFYQTSEGIWLAENAHRYGFTLSYPRGALDITGFYFEPWHFRFVGEEMATFLKETETYLTEFQLKNQPEPCIP